MVPREGSSQRNSGCQFVSSSLGDRLGERIVIDIEFCVRPFERLEWLLQLPVTIPVSHTELLVLVDPHLHQTRDPYYGGVFRFTVP